MSKYNFAAGARFEEAAGLGILLKCCPEIYRHKKLVTKSYSKSGPIYTFQYINLSNCLTSVYKKLNGQNVKKKKQSLFYIFFHKATVDVS